MNIAGHHGSNICYFFLNLNPEYTLEVQDSPEGIWELRFPAGVLQEKHPGWGSAARIPKSLLCDFAYPIYDLFQTCSII